jgi:hypothetical protein
MHKPTEGLTLLFIWALFLTAFKESNLNFFNLQFETAIRIYILEANVVIITTSWWEVVQRRIPGSSIN